MWKVWEEVLITARRAHGRGARVGLSKGTRGVKGTLGIQSTCFARRTTTAYGMSQVRIHGRRGHKGREGHSTTSVTLHSFETT
jgi:hypothetical protein